MKVFLDAHLVPTKLLFCNETFLYDSNKLMDDMDLMDGIDVMDKAKSTFMSIVH